MSLPGPEDRSSMHGIPLSFSAAAPPMIFVVLALIGALAGLRWRRLGALVAIPSTVLLYAFSTPAMSSLLLAIAAATPVSADIAAQPAQAIVLLAADAQRGQSPGSPDLPGPLALERIVESAALHRTTGLPILVTGGPIPESSGNYADMMSAALKKDFGIDVQWRETISRNTLENAALSAPILKQAGITTVLVVAHDWDMPRALWAFRRAGLSALPAVAGRPSLWPEDLDPSDFFPSARGFQDTFYALHEILGLQYYRWRFG